MNSRVQWLKEIAISAWNNITLEPVVVLYLTSMGLNEVIRPNLLILKACRQKLNYTQDICDSLTEDGFEDFQEDVQLAVSDYESTLNLCTFPPRIIFALMAGAWSDRNGRKAIIALPIFGQVLVNITYILNYKYLLTWPFEMLYLEFVNELCGTFVVYYLAVYSYMADVTSEATRTSRIGFVDGTDYICTMFGTFISSYIFESFGFYAIYGSSATLAFLAVLYIAFFIKESVGRPPQHDESKSGSYNDLSQVQNQNYGSTDSQTPKRRQANDGKCCPQPSDITTGFMTILKKREGIKRTMLLMLIFNFACYIFTYNGTEGSHRYLFVRNKYGWDTEDLTRYLSIYRILYLITLWILLPLASKYFHLHDAMVALISCTLGAIGQGLPAFFAPAWVFYLGAVIACVSPAATITARSMASRCVSPHEVGKVFAVISLMSAVSSSLISAAYQEIYSATLLSFPGTFLLVNASFFALTIPFNAFLLQKNI